MAHPTASARSRICGEPSEATWAVSAVSVSAAGAHDVGMEVAGELGLGDLAIGVELRVEQAAVQRQGFAGLLRAVRADAATPIAEHWRDAEAAYDARRDLPDYLLKRPGWWHRPRGSGRPDLTGSSVRTDCFVGRAEEN